MPRQRSSGGRLTSLLVLVGCAVVLGGTFLLGVGAGRMWPTFRFSGAPEATAAKEAPSSRADQGARLPDSGPKLTFYQELTKPLTAPPPPPRPRRAEERTQTATKPDGGDDATAPSVAAAGPASATTYTIQVGAYRERAQADKLQARLVTAGYPVAVVEGAGPSGVLYRVRVGAFATREAAQASAARLAREQSLTAFVTTH